MHRDMDRIVRYMSRYVSYHSHAVSLHPTYSEIVTPLIITSSERRRLCLHPCWHCIDVIISSMASQVTSLFSCRSNQTPKLRVTGSCAGNSPVTGEFPAQEANNAENVSIWRRHHVCRLPFTNTAAKIHERISWSFNGSSQMAQRVWLDCFILG